MVFSRKDFVRELSFLVTYSILFTAMVCLLVCHIFTQNHFLMICFTFISCLIYIFLIQNTWYDLIKDFDNRSKELNTQLNVIHSNGHGGGNWHEPSSWVGYEVPNTGDVAVINNGDTITVRNNSAHNFDIKYKFETELENETTKRLRKLRIKK